MTNPLLSIKNLTISFETPAGPFYAVRDVSLTVEKGETLALVGESGSGKSLTALSILKLLPKTAHIAPQSVVTFGTHYMMTANASTLQNIRGGRVGIIFQEPLTALNPLHTLQQQIVEMLTLHQPHLTSVQIELRVKELLEMVELDHLKNRLSAYPHELSGGQRQRVMIAMALANNPALLIADEPTTALDVTVQAEILKLLKTLQEKMKMALLLITHDLGIVRHMAQRVAVMQTGRLVEQGTNEDIFIRPQNPYTKRLISAKPTQHRAPVLENAPVLLEAKNINVRFPIKRGFFGAPTQFVTAVDCASFTLFQGETVGIVGESGSGKTTLALALLGLLKSSGSVTFQGQDISHLSKPALRSLRAKMQIVFQDPFGSLSPRMSIGDIVAEGLRVHRKDLSATAQEEKVITALQDVHLDPDARHRYPHEFSGGQRQRVAIARALVLNPALMILDEPTSALDVTIQAQVIDVLLDLQRKYGLSYLFITHDLRVIQQVAHRVLVMKEGQIVESGPAETVLSSPENPYTQALLRAALTF